MKENFKRYLEALKAAKPETIIKNYMDIRKEILSCLTQLNKQGGGAIVSKPLSKFYGYHVLVVKEDEFAESMVVRVLPHGVAERLNAADFLRIAKRKVALH